MSRDIYDLRQGQSDHDACADIRQRCTRRVAMPSCDSGAARRIFSALVAVVTDRGRISQPPRITRHRTGLMPRRWRCCVDRAAVPIPRLATVICLVRFVERHSPAMLHRRPIPSAGSRWLWLWWQDGMHSRQVTADAIPPTIQNFHPLVTV